MTKFAKSIHKKLAWILIIGSVATGVLMPESSDVLPVIAAVALIAGVVYAAGIEFVDLFTAEKQ